MMNFVLFVQFILISFVFNLWVAQSKTIKGTFSSIQARKEKGQYLSTFGFHGENANVLTVYYLNAGASEAFQYWGREY